MFTLLLTLLVLCALVLRPLPLVHGQISEVSQHWVELKPPDGNKFTGRNNHATCQFKGRLWLSAGRSQVHPIYNLKFSVKENDVWYSDDGARWVNLVNMTGDFYLQNKDVIQPGPYAPWYQRFGHSMDPVIDSVGTEIMILIGGYAPGPSNDMWITHNGWEWSHSVFKPGTPQFSPRAWHRTTIFGGKLWMMGGSPLNNEVWRLDSIERVARAPISSTRSMYLDYTYHLTWAEVSANAVADWSPRVGFGLMTQWYHDHASSDYRMAGERLILTAGYGGWPQMSAYDSSAAQAGREFNGYACLSDVWESFDGVVWTKLADTTAMGPRAWFGAAVFSHPDEPRIDVSLSSGFEVPRMWIYGGGNLGFTSESKAVIDVMDGRSDGFWSRDGVTWHLTNYLEGGGTSVVEFYSSQEWTVAQVDGAIKFLGVWGHTVEMFRSFRDDVFDAMFFVAGDMTGQGSTRNQVFQSQEGIFCDMDNLVCGGAGTCLPKSIDGVIVNDLDGNPLTFRYQGCECPELAIEGMTYTGEYCMDVQVDTTGGDGGGGGGGGTLLLIAIIGGAAVALGIAYTIFTK